jgi:hypothetical protein
LAADFDKTSWMDDVSAFLETCRLNGLCIAVERSRSGNGARVWFFFSAPVPASTARKMGCYLITETMSRRPARQCQRYRLIGGRRSFVTLEEKVKAIAATGPVVVARGSWFRDELHRETPSQRREIDTPAPSFPLPIHPNEWRVSILRHCLNCGVASTSLAWLTSPRISLAPPSTACCTA